MVYEPHPGSTSSAKRKRQIPIRAQSGQVPIRLWADCRSNTQNLKDANMTGRPIALLLDGTWATRKQVDPNTLRGAVIAETGRVSSPDR